HRAQRSAGERRDAGRAARRSGSAVQRHPLSHDRRAGAHPRAHPHLRQRCAGARSGAAAETERRSRDRAGAERGLSRCNQVSPPLNEEGWREAPGWCGSKRKTTPSATPSRPAPPSQEGNAVLSPPLMRRGGAQRRGGVVYATRYFFIASFFISSFFMPSLPMASFFMPSFAMLSFFMVSLPMLSFFMSSAASAKPPPSVNAADMITASN